MGVAHSCLRAVEHAFYNILENLCDFLRYLPVILPLRDITVSNMPPLAFDIRNQSYRKIGGDQSYPVVYGRDRDVISVW